MLNCFGAVWIVEFIQVMITGSLEVTQELVFILFLYSFPLPFFSTSIVSILQVRILKLREGRDSLRIQD